VYLIEKLDELGVASVSRGQLLHAVGGAPVRVGMNGRLKDRGCGGGVRGNGGDNAGGGIIDLELGGGTPSWPCRRAQIP
jgi:hypothetical protein